MPLLAAWRFVRLQARTVLVVIASLHAVVAHHTGADPLAYGLHAAEGPVKPEYLILTLGSVPRPYGKFGRLVNESQTTRRPAYIPVSVLQLQLSTNI